MVSTCEPYDDTDEVQPYSFFMLASNDENSSMCVDDSFMKKDVVLYNENVNYTLMVNEYDSIVFLYSYSCINDCENFSVGEEKYIGFKFTKDGNDRLGWIKLRLVPVWGTVDTNLIETAIQN